MNNGQFQLRRTYAAVVLLALVAIALYAPLIGWGMPYATAPDRTKTFATDEILPLEALAEMHNTFVVSKPNRNYGYPWWHYFVVAVAQAPYVASLKISGELESPIPEFPFGLKDPVGSLRTLTLIGRSVSVIMAAGVVVAAYYFSAALWGHVPGIIAAVLTMLNYLMFYYSRTGNLDVPACFWTSIGLAIFAKILANGFTVRRAVWLGVFAGLAMATKDQAVVIFLPLGCALLLPRFSRSPRSGYDVQSILAGLGGALCAYVIGTGMIIDPQRHFTHVYSLIFDQARITGAAAYWTPHPKTWSGTMHLIVDYIGALVAVASPLVLLTSVAGALIVLRSSPWYLVLVLPVLTLFFMVILPTGIVVQRYLLPLMLILDAFAARALVSLRQSFLRPAWMPLLLVLCGWRLVVAADLTYAQIHDTRYAAAKWIQTHAEPGDRLEYFGVTEVLPPLSAEIKTRRIAGRVNWVGEFGHGRATIRYLAEEGPEYIAIIPDWTSQPGMAHSGDCPPEVYAALIDGRIGYGQVASFLPPSLPFSSLKRPPLDNPSVAPPVRLFGRSDISQRGGHHMVRVQR